MAKLLCALALAAVCAAAQTVEGSVFDAATGAGIPGVKVELIKGGTPFYEASTDGGGRFRFDNIREGDYAIRYQSPEYWSTAGFDYRYFLVTAANPVKIDARLMPWSKITGRVVDGRGNPIPNARLELTGSGIMINGRTYVRTSWGGGGGGALRAAPLVMGHMGQADAHGKFEVQVMPGDYTLAVLPPADLKPPEHAADDPKLVWTKTWYPGVPAQDAASKIVVLPGGGTTEVELKLAALPAHAIRGVVFNPDGTPAAKAAILLGQPPRPSSVEAKPDGTFEIPAVPEGEWALTAEVDRGSSKLRATEWVEVAKHDVENLKLHVHAPLTIRGKVILDAPKEAPPPRPIPFVLTMQGGRTRAGADLLAPGAVFLPNNSGEIVGQEAYPGLYRFSPQLQSPPAPFYLDAVRVGGADLTLQDVEIDSDATITIVYKTDGGSVTGKAENCVSGGVLLEPADPARRQSGFAISGPCDANDHYEIRAVRPGDYYAMAFAGNGPVLTVDDALLAQGTKVTVRSGEATSADLRTITKPVY
jgi:hypothetical protein